MKYHVLLTGRQIDALIDAHFSLSPYMKAGPLQTALDQLDEQKANQDHPWERCKACKGSGWIEDFA